ncbi:hypothetical protein F8C90_06215 [Ellagibacter isourolithinifaciens]|uniref:Uncharacterized protein n=1 Tax=Ellagibacter isourolithinifaciens TaxID=2137581 RepID=A0A6N6NS32_9ACTN|nr:hypothetical protein F8C90_06215 [Ellagibacter isourolithinifaciens]
MWDSCARFVIRQSASFYPQRRSWSGGSFNLRRRPWSGAASACEDAPGRGGMPRAQTVLAALRNCARGTSPRPGGMRLGAGARNNVAA